MDRTEEYIYELPPELIATRPSPERGGSRLMVVDRSSGNIQHGQFSDLPGFLKPDDLLILNNSRVIPASLRTVDGKFEVLLLEETSPQHWVALVKPGRKAPQGIRLFFAPLPGKDCEPIEAEVLRTLEEGERVLRFFHPFELENYGEPPLPPYILKKRKLEADGGGTEREDWERYQTVYADESGSVAAPTAGLHFTPEMLASLPHAFVTLHVGLGTFRPVKVEYLKDHVMHEERYSMPAHTAELAKAAGRIVAVGTTAARVLESVPALQGCRGRTRIFIRPPYRFKHVGAMVTNFHLPKSTLLMMVGAFAGVELMREAYRKAIEEKYRFFSYGDAMLIL